MIHAMRHNNLVVSCVTHQSGPVVTAVHNDCTLDFGGFFFMSFVDVMALLASAAGLQRAGMLQNSRTHPTRAFPLERASLPLNQLSF